MNFNSNFKYDLEVGQSKENELAEILSNSKVEVKYDRKATETGNVFVEYSSRGKPSGMAVSEADYYVYYFGDIFVIIKSEDLKKKCRKYVNTNRDVVGGDNNTSKGILLPIIDFFKKT